MNKLYKFYWDCDRMGEIEGVFVADDEEVNKLIFEQINFGEVLGKHSEVFGTIEEKDIVVISENQEFIERLVEVFDSYTISGYNPLDYFEEEEEDFEEEED